MVVKDAKEAVAETTNAVGHAKAALSNFTEDVDSVEVLLRAEAEVGIRHELRQPARQAVLRATAPAAAVTQRGVLHQQSTRTHTQSTTRRSVMLDTTPGCCGL
ncbi:hypothetical protein DQ04_11881000, partial [Trypanosoma grayi]|uniref:hypothetical protein n=1 Tax=Trypanosoma grayi TaxID=71804 RepID=UPI0004F42A9F